MEEVNGMLDEYLTAQAGADYLRLSRRTVYYLARQGKLPMRKGVRGRWTISKQAMDVWLRANPR